MNNELTHFGILGMKWGVRRYQNKDGSLTSTGKNRIKEGVTERATYAKNRLLNPIMTGKAELKSRSKDNTKTLFRRSVYQKTSEIKDVNDRVAKTKKDRQDKRNDAFKSLNSKQKQKALDTKRLTGQRQVDKILDKMGKGYTFEQAVESTRASRYAESAAYVALGAIGGWTLATIF